MGDEEYSKIIPWKSLSQSAKYSFIYLHPELREKTLDDEIAEMARDSPKEFIRSQIETSGKEFKAGKGKKHIDKVHNIIYIAEMFGIKVKKNKCICPFHNDKDPSMSLDPKNNLFYCFGCQAKGDIIDFYGRLKDGQKTINKRTN